MKPFLIKVWERTTTKLDREIGKHKLNEMGTLNMKQKKWKKLDKSKRSSYSSVVFKHDCSLETYLELWRKKGNTQVFVYKYICIFQKISRKFLDFKKGLQVFLLDPSFGDIEFYSSVNQSWYN